MRMTHDHREARLAACRASPGVAARALAGDPNGAQACARTCEHPHTRKLLGPCAIMRTGPTLPPVVLTLAGSPADTFTYAPPGTMRTLTTAAPSEAKKPVSSSSVTAGASPRSENENRIAAMAKVYWVPRFVGAVSLRWNRGRGAAGAVRSQSRRRLAAPGRRGGGERTVQQDAPRGRSHAVSARTSGRGANARSAGAGASARTSASGADAGGHEHLPAPAPEEPMQGVRGREHLPAPAHQEPMQGVRGRGPLPAPAHQEHMQGVRGRGYLPAPAPEETMQGVQLGGACAEAQRANPARAQHH